MTLLSWNCRGLGSPQAVRDLCQLAKENRARILFLMETKCSKVRIEMVRVKLGFTGAFTVDPVGRSGGLALLWKEEQEVEIQNFSRRHINAIIMEEGVQPWKLTGFYGHPEWAKRHEAWDLLSHLKSYLPDPWLVIGDFNEILEQSEKEGGIQRREAQMDLFRNTLENCQLSDLGFIGPKFTWVNSRFDGTFIRERLDRAVANRQWCSLHGRSVVNVLAACSSDHNPLAMTIFSREENEVRQQRGFKVEASWMLDDEYNGIVQQAWDEGELGDTAITTARLKLANCQADLKRWSRKKFGNADRELKKKRKQLLELQSSFRVGVAADVKRLQDEINFILEQEDIRWKQRAKQNWYQYGDQNTPFFHAWASHRKRVNRIWKIKDEEGREWKKPKEIGAAFCTFYQNLFAAGDTRDVEESLCSVEPRVTADMNAALLREYKMEEVELALSQMHPLKSPGPDGFSACFYQKSWATVKSEVNSAVLDFLNNGFFDSALNETHIALVPKKKNPSCLTDYRPISLCNVLYKLIAKVVANRLKKVLGTIISPVKALSFQGG
jgi:hypothetical protein